MSATGTSVGRSAGTRPMRGVAAKLTLELWLDQLRVDGGPRRPVDRMLLLAIVQANLGHLMREDDLQVAHADMEHPLPDALRRPISINALASSLGLPFETMRRRVNHLLEEGVCRQAMGGIIVPCEVQTRPEQALAVAHSYQRLRRFYFDFKPLGVLPNLPPPEHRFEADPMLLVVRLFGAYLLRVMDTVNQHFGDVLDGLLFMALVYLNIRAITAADLERAGGPEGLDPLRRPVRAAQLAAYLELPAETVRRRVVRLAAEQNWRRTPMGFVAPASALEARNASAAMQENLPDLQRLFTRFAQLGVLEFWERQGP